MQNPDFEGRSFVEPSHDWVRPEKTIGGHNTIQYFSMLFADETAAKLAVKSRNFSTPLYENLLPLIHENDKIYDDLKTKGLYFYPQGGSLFMDYKIMRSQWYKFLISQKGEKPEDIQKQFNESMTAKELIEKARSFVETWWDVPTLTRVLS